MKDFFAPISEQIWNDKYRLAKSDGTMGDATLEGTWRRVAVALAQAEKPDQQTIWTDRFYDALRDFKFLPAGRILSGAGTERNVTLFNCYVMGTIPDSMDGIFTMLKEAALTMQQGGGIGYDFSTLRPKGAPVKGVAADASGPLAFMDVWDAMCRTVMSAGSRRGAMMATMRCDHPDILDFIKAKKDAARLRMFNLSVLVTDEFMAAVEEDEWWPLYFNGTLYHGMPARSLWDAIMRSTYDVAEPGVIFIDRINEQNNLRYCETIAATNPCGEQPLPPYGACLLGSINLAALVEDPFSDMAGVGLINLEALVTTAVRMLDNVVDVSRFPLPQQAEEARAKRRIGLGVTGLADALAMCGVRYGSDGAVSLTAVWLECIRNAAYRASIDLAKEKGPFPVFDANGYLGSGTFAWTLLPTIKADIRKNGIRNSHLLSIAPTGTISLYAGNVSSGIEPIFAASYTRKVLEKDGCRREEVVEDYAVSRYRDYIGDGPEVDFRSSDLPEYFVTAQNMDPIDHVRMQAVAQRYVDSSISKTINVPADISFDAFKDVYLEAYRSGCKGCTTYRPNETTGSVLSMEPKPANEQIDDTMGESAVVMKPTTTEHFAAADAQIRRSLDAQGASTRANLSGKFVDLPTYELPDRPEQLIGRTYKLKYPELPHAIYVTINDLVEGDGRRPFEIFINSKNMEHYAWTVALTRMVSAIFRRGGDVAFVAEELKQVFDPRGGGWVNGTYIPSVLAAIGEIIERHMHGAVDKAQLLKSEQPDAQHHVRSGALPSTCPRCGSYSITMQEGCEVCLSCGHSKCE